jgi:hypothetical protein
MINIDNRNYHRKNAILQVIATSFKYQLSVVTDGISFHFPCVLNVSHIGGAVTAWRPQSSYCAYTGIVRFYVNFTLTRLLTIEISFTFR